MAQFLITESAIHFLALINDCFYLSHDMNHLLRYWIIPQKQTDLNFHIWVLKRSLSLAPASLLVFEYESFPGIHDRTSHQELERRPC